MRNNFCTKRMGNIDRGFILVYKFFSPKNLNQWVFKHLRTYVVVSWHTLLVAASWTKLSTKKGLGRKCRKDVQMFLQSMRNVHIYFFSRLPLKEKNLLKVLFQEILENSLGVLQTFSCSCELVDNSNLFVAKWFLAYLITTGGCTRDAVQSVGGQDKQYKKLWINPFGTWSLYYYHDGSVILAHETGKTCLQVCSLQCVNNKCLQQFSENTSLISTRKERYTRFLGFASN